MSISLREEFPCPNKVELRVPDRVTAAHFAAAHFTSVIAQLASRLPLLSENGGYADGEEPGRFLCEAG